MSASFNKYQIFRENVYKGIHVLFGTAGSGANTLKGMLSNTAPNAATHAVRGDASEISAGNGYTAGGVSLANVMTRSGGTVTLVATDFTITASGGDVAAFRYVVIYDDTPTSPADPLVGWYDYGASITLHDTETFTTDFGANLFTDS
jgi:hypothetical protein